MRLSPEDIRRMRQFHQQLSATAFSSPAQVVAHLGAMQAQEYPMATWAVGLRLRAGTVAKDVEQAFQQGKILRTHLLRPTWHFVAAGDIRWLVKLTAPHVQRLNGIIYRKHGLTPELLSRAAGVLEKALEPGQLQTREQLQEALHKAGISVSGNALAYVVMNAELEGLVCSGPRQGKKFTYALLDRAAGPAAPFHREEALARLAQRYFASRGPATVRDFAYWSGLPARDARLGASSLDSRFQKALTDGGEELLFQEPPALPRGPEVSFLLPDYDEYGMGYQNRDAMAPIFEPEQPPSPYSHWLIVAGRLAGTWQFSAKDRGQAAVTPYAPLTAAEAQAVEAAVGRYRNFWA